MDEKEKGPKRAIFPRFRRGVTQTSSCAQGHFIVGQKWRTRPQKVCGNFAPAFDANRDQSVLGLSDTSLLADGLVL